jgi:hypothetical protein
MKVNMVAFPSPVSKLYFGWSRGMEIHGDSVVQLPLEANLSKINADCYYQTNERKRKFFRGNRANTQGQFFDFILKSKKPFIVSESNPFRKFDGWMRFGWNSYKWTEGNFNNDNVGRDRWERFQSITGASFKDWNSPGDYILIMGQKEGDSALNSMYEKGYLTFYDWVETVIMEIRKHTDRPIKIRPHPRGLEKGLRTIARRIENGLLQNVIISENVRNGGNQGGEGLEHDLLNSYCVVTYNSLSSIEAAELGIPVFALDDGCMAYPIAHKDLKDIENINYNIDLTQWQNQIAYTMWNKEDVESGKTWAHLKPVYFK